MNDKQKVYIRNAIEKVKPKLLKQNSVIKVCEDGKVTYTKTCRVSGEEYSVTVDEKEHAKWQLGALIQNIFPELSADQREFLISGITPAEWDVLFK